MNGFVAAVNKNNAFHKGRRLSGTLSSSSSSLLSSLSSSLLGCAVNENFYNVDWGRGIFPLFSSPPRGIWQLKCLSPLVPDARGLARGQIGAVGFDWFLGWCISPLRRLENSLVFVPIDCQLIINIALSHHAQTKLDDCGVFVTNQ